MRPEGQEAWLGAATLRALSGDAQLQWSGQHLYRGTEWLPLWAAHHQEVPPQTGQQRGLLDGAALWMRHGDPAWHARHRPAEPVAALVFDLLEQLRVESIAPAHWPGVQRNLAVRFLRWCEELVEGGLTETHLGLLIFTVALTAWSRIGGHEVPGPMGDLMEATRAHLSTELGHELARLRATRHEPRAFTPVALAVALWVSESVARAQAQVPRGATRTSRRSAVALRLLPPAQALAPMPVAVSGDSAVWQASGQSYRAFTRAYDRQATAADRVRPEQLRQWRVQMDEEGRTAHAQVLQLAQRFRQGLAETEQDGWRFGLEEGLLDGARLAQLVGNPLNRAVYKDVDRQARVRCAVTLLLDCSGSMKAHAQSLSILVDVLGRALDLAGVEVEILGFTTGAWNGGRALRDWQRAGRPQGPGRLNETLHLVFKSAQEPWRSGRQGLAALRRADLYREGVDGEALLWAAQRLLSSQAERRFLMVISDGCPMDSATHQANDAHYLDQHLQQVLAGLAQAAQVQVLGLGVGLDLGVFYRHRLTVNLPSAQAPSAALLHEVANFLLRTAHGLGGR